MGTHHHKTFERSISDVIQAILDAKANASMENLSNFHVECLDVAENAVRLITYHENEIQRVAKGREA